MLNEFEVQGLNIKKGSLAVLAQVQLKPYLFADLPVSPTASTIAYITDSSTASGGEIISGSGTNTVLARWDGSNWLVLGGGISSQTDLIQSADLAIADEHGMIVPDYYEIGPGVALTIGVDAVMEIT